MKPFLLKKNTPTQSRWFYRNPISHVLSRRYCDFVISLSVRVFVMQLFEPPRKRTEARQVNGLKPAIVTSSRTNISNNVDSEKRDLVRVRIFLPIKER